MLTQRINESTQNNYNSRVLGNMKLNLNSVNPYFNYDQSSKIVREEKGYSSSINNRNNQSCNNIQNFSANDIQFQRMNSQQSNEKYDLQHYKKEVNSLSVTDRINYNISGNINQYPTQFNQRRSDFTQSTPSIACFNCSSNLQLNELQQHHTDNCCRENPQVEGLNSLKAIQQIDSKLERINAYFAALLIEQKNLGIKERRALILKEIVQRALHSTYSPATFQNLINEINQEFPSTILDYLYSHAIQIKNIISIKLSVIPQQEYRSISPNKQNASLSSSNFFISNNYNQKQSSSQLRIKTEVTPRSGTQNLSEANIYQLNSENQNLGYHSPQININKKNNIFKLINTSNSGNKNTNLFNNYLTNQQNSNQLNDGKFNNNSISNFAKANNTSASGFEGNSNGSYYQLPQQNINQSAISLNNNYSSTQAAPLSANFKHIPTFQINLNHHPSSNTQTTTNSSSIYSSNSNKSSTNNIKDSNSSQKCFTEYYTSQISSTSTYNSQNKPSSIVTPTQHIVNSQQIFEKSIASPSRFTFSNNLEQPTNNPKSEPLSHPLSTNSPYPQKSIPTFSSQLSNNFSTTVSTNTNDKNIGQSQIFFPSTQQTSPLQPVNTNIASNQYRSLSPSVNLGQPSYQSYQDTRNRLQTEGNFRASSPQPNLLVPKPCFSSPQQITFQQDFGNNQPNSRTFKSQRVLNFDIKDIEKMNLMQPKVEKEEQVKKMNNTMQNDKNNNGFNQSATSYSSDILNQQSVSKNELISKLIQKQKDLQNLQSLSSQLKQNYEIHQDEINKVYNINNLNSSRSPVPSNRIKTSTDSSLSYINQENFYSQLLKQQTSSHNNSTEITQSSLLSPNQLSSMNEILSEDDKILQSVFYNICLKEKMNIPRNHLAQKLPVSLLFKEALEMNIRDEESMKYFIQYAFENATTYIDVDKLKKSNKNQIFKNNLANKVFLQQPQ